MEQQTSITRKSLADPFDDNNINSEVRRFLVLSRIKCLFVKVLKVKTYYCPILSDIVMDLSRRLPHYFSDYYDSK